MLGSFQLVLAVSEALGNVTSCLSAVFNLKGSNQASIPITPFYSRVLKEVMIEEVHIKIFVML